MFGWAVTILCYVADTEYCNVTLNGSFDVTLSEFTLLMFTGTLIFGVSVSEPHTSELNCDFSYILLSGERRSVYF